MCSGETGKSEPSSRVIHYLQTELNFILPLNKIINNKMTFTTIKVNKGILPVLRGISKQLEIVQGDELLVLGSRDSLVLKKVSMPKTFSEIVEPIREKIKKQGITQRDVEKAITEVRK